MIVVDANVLVYRYVHGPFTRSAQALLNQDADWRVPRLWRYEFVNALVTMLRNNLLNEHDALSAWTSADEDLAPRESSIAQDQVLARAAQYRISGYDAQYIALAELMSLQCVTADKPLARKARGIAVLLDEFIAPQDRKKL